MERTSCDDADGPLDADASSGKRIHAPGTTRLLTPDALIHILGTPEMPGNLYPIHQIAYALSVTPGMIWRWGKLDRHDVVLSIEPEGGCQPDALLAFLQDKAGSRRVEKFLSDHQLKRSRNDISHLSSMEAVVRAQYERVAVLDLEHVSYEDFATLDPDTIITRLSASDSVLAKYENTHAGNIPSGGRNLHTNDLYQFDLLTAEDEQALFRRMSLLFHWANMLRSSLSPRSPDPALMTQIEAIHAEAIRCLNVIWSCNLRLTIDVSKAFVRPGYSWDEANSDAEFHLRRIIQKTYDCTKEASFGNWATEGLGMALHSQERKRRRYHGKEGQRPLDDDGAPLPGADIDFRTPRTLLEKEAAYTRQSIWTLLDALDERERRVMVMRYGLDGREPMTLKEIGEQLDLTRERIRQIETEALEKMGAEAQSRQIEPPGA